MEQLALDPRAAAAGAFAEEYLQPVLIFEEYRQQLPQDVFDPITAIIKVCPPGASAKHCYGMYPLSSAAPFVKDI
jgi:hypothetical protein